MNKTQFVNQLSNKDDVSSTFLVKHISVQEGKDGKSYLNAILSDKSGELESRKWQGAESVFQAVKPGDYVSVSGKINLFQNRLQLIINEISKISPEKILDLENFIQKSLTPPDAMFEELLTIIQSLPEVYLRDLLLSIVQDPEIKRRLKIWQAGKSIHHAYQSGLLEHILSCTRLALILSPHYKVNTSYVVAGCILHDICKVYELTEGPVVDYTEEGKLIGHLVKGLEIVDHFAYRIKNFPYSVKLHLKHILLSHHGELDYGSPKTPHTLEAFLVHLIDLMDSKMSALKESKESDSNVGRWTNYIKHLDRTIYKPELPSHTEYVVSSSSSENEVHSQTKEKNSTNKGEKELKQSLGDFLKDFKVE